MGFPSWIAGFTGQHAPRTNQSNPNWSLLCLMVKNPETMRDENYLQSPTWVDRSHCSVENWCASPPPEKTKKSSTKSPFKSSYDFSISSVDHWVVPSIPIKSQSRSKNTEIPMKSHQLPMKPHEIPLKSYKMMKKKTKSRSIKSVSIIWLGNSKWLQTAPHLIGNICWEYGDYHCSELLLPSHWIPSGKLTVCSWKWP